MHLDTVTKKVAAIRPISKSFAFLIDGEGKLLAHPKADLALKPASEIAKGIDAGMLTKLASDSTRADVLIDGADQMLCAAPDGQVKFPHPWPPQIPPGRTAGL